MCTIRRTCMLSYRMQFSRAEISLLKRRIAGIPDSCLSAGSAALCEVNCRTTPADDDDEMATRRRLLDEQSYSMLQSAVQLCSSVCALHRPMNSQQPACDAPQLWTSSLLLSVQYPLNSWKIFSPTSIINCMQNGTMNERLCGARVCHQNEFELFCSRRSDIFTAHSTRVARGRSESVVHS